MPILTVNELAESNDFDYAEASNLLKVLVKLRIAQSVGVRPNPAGRGKGSNLFSIPLSFSISLKDKLTRNEAGNAMSVTVPSQDVNNDNQAMTSTTGEFVSLRVTAGH